MPIKNPMNLAIKLALDSIRNGEVPVGCVITDSKNKIVSYSSNSMIKLNDPLAHAEIIAIRKACKSDDNIIPYIIEAVNEYATLGEIVDAMKDIFGEWHETSII